MAYQVLKCKKKKKLQLIFNVIKSFLPLILSHHPNCGDFKTHTIKIKGYQFCIGCFVGYPSALIGMGLIGLSYLPLILSSEAFFIIGAILIFSFILSPLGIIRSKPIKIIQKFTIGMGASFTYWGIRLLTIPRTDKYVLFLLIFGPLVSILNLYHTYGFLKTCKKCATPFNWAICDGFKMIRENFARYNLYNYLEPMSEFSQKIEEKRKLKKNTSH
jgi:hypothetical protein